MYTDYLSNLHLPYVPFQAQKKILLMKTRDCIQTALDYKNDCVPALALWGNYLEVHAEVRHSFVLNGSNVTVSL